MGKNLNLKELHRKVKDKPKLKNVANYANISQGQLSNIIYGRRKANPELQIKIAEGLRRELR